MEKIIFYIWIFTMSKQTGYFLQKSGKVALIAFCILTYIMVPQSANAQKRVKFVNHFFDFQVAVFASFHQFWGMPFEGEVRDLRLE